MKGGWVEDNKGDTVRSRFVAKQVANDQKDDVSKTAHLPPLAQHRGLLAPIFCGSAVVLFICDISVAFFHVVMDELVYVYPPRDMVPPVWFWKSRRDEESEFTSGPTMSGA